MSRKPLMVAVDCDSCGEGAVFHGRGQEISVQWLEANLIKQGWVFADGKDYCLKCKDDIPAEAKPKAKRKRKRGKKKKAGNRPPARGAGGGQSN
jgi:hypothetical protein